MQPPEKRYLIVAILIILAIVALGVMVAGFTITSALGR